MNVQRGLIITCFCGFAFGLIGAGLGFLLGTIAPDYYRTVFRMPPDIEIDVAQAGLGLGLTQGIGAGLVVGLVIVVTVAWYNSRTLLASATSAPKEDSKTQQS